MRVTAEDVKEIMDNCTVEDPIVETCIISAEEVINRVFLNDATVGTTLLREIERWFAAHIVASVFQRTVADEKLGDAEIKYAAKYGDNLHSTPYGQMVITLDISGKMVSMAGKRAISMLAIPSFNKQK